MFRFTYDFKCCQKIETENRKVVTNDSQANLIYGSNKVINSKYTWYSFVPLILFAHLCRFMNLYFILIGCLQLWKDVSPVNPFTTWLPIIVIFAIAFVREGIDDIHQHRQDRNINSRTFSVIRDSQEITIRSEDILTGDIVVLEKGSECPADLAMIFSSNDNGTCGLETSNLDGETTIKEKRAIPATQNLGVGRLAGEKLLIDCSAPNELLNDFDSTIKVGNDVYSLSNENFIQSGTKIKNANRIYGVACYTGKKTKIGMNMKSPPIKWTQIERFIDKCSISIFVFQLVLAIIWGIVGNIEMDRFKKDMPYLRLDMEEGTSHVLIYFRAYLLTSVMIPISLKVTLDICKYVYATWIRNDAKMYDRPNRLRPLVNNTSVIEDLGAVQYIFTDKTGTITENKMVLQKIIIGDQIFGASEQGEDIYSDNNLVNLFLRKSDDSERLDALYFMFCLACCHSLKNSGTDEQPVFEGLSPEEVCFINGLTKLKIGVTLNADMIGVFSESLGIEQTSFKIHAVLPYNTTNRHMSVVVEKVDTNEFFLFNKGSAEVLGKMSIQQEGFMEHVVMFASLGLRVMAVSYRRITHDEFDQFKESYDSAQRSTSDRASKIKESFLPFESDQILLGITGIEDALQVDVPETIAMMRAAGIKVWMITGDMKETAVKIAHSSGLISPNATDIFDLTSPNSGATCEEILDNLDAYFNEISSNPDNINSENKNNEKESNEVYLVIDGDQPMAQELLTEHNLKFAQVASKATCVICARTRPKQKAEYVKAIQRLNKVTLAVGDGGNDVTMLREAHIGVGILGLEGTQASVASDFAIKQFCHLQRLLLIHGRFASYRTSWLVQFCFYKSIMLSLVQVSFNFWNGFSATSFISDFNLMCYNAIFTLLPVVFFLFDKDVEDDTVFLHPYLYADSRLRTFCNIRSMFWWVVKAFYQAIVVVLVIHYCNGEQTITLSDGSPVSLNEMQQQAYSSLILNVLFTVTFDTQQFTSLNHIFIWGNWLLYIIFTIIANLIPNLEIVRDMYLTVWRTYANPLFWMIVVTASSLSVLPVIFFNSMFSTFLPTRAQKLRFCEIKKQSKFKPAYMVLKPGEKGNKVMKETVWDKSHNICLPLGTLLCGCHQ